MRQTLLRSSQTLLPVLSILAFAPAPAGAQSVSLTLPAAVRQALTNNPNALAAASTLAQAQARVGQAQAARRLQITFNSTGSLSNASVYQQPPSQETFGTFQNTLAVPVPLGGRTRLLLEQSRRLLDAAQAQNRASRFALAAQVAAAYYDLLRRDALLAVARETLAQAQRQLSDAQKRERAGDAAALDVLQSQGPVASAQAALIGAQSAQDTARETLNNLVGRPLEDPLTVAAVPLPPLSAMLSYTPAQVRALAVQNSPDVQAADQTVRADQAAVAGTRLFRQPTLEVQAIDIRSKDVTSFRREDTVQAAVTVPLSDGGLGRAQVQEAEAVLLGARALAAATRRAVAGVASAVLLAAQSTRAQLAAALTAQQIAQISYAKTVQGYENGLFPLISVLAAQTSLAQARIAYTQAVYDAAVAQGALQGALNGGAIEGTEASGTTGPTGPASAAPIAPTPGGAPGAPNAGPPSTSPSPSGTSPAGAGSPGTSPAGTGTATPSATGAP